MRFPVPSRALTAAAASAAILAAGAAAAPAAVAAGSASLEAERFSLPTTKVRTFADSTASGGSAVKLGGNATITGTVTTAAAQRLVVRARGDQYLGAPTMVVHVDGRRVASTAVSATGWTSYRIDGSWAAGQHTVQIAFTNDAYSRGRGDRNLRVDLVTFSGDSTATPPLDDAYEARIVDLVNTERRKAGVAPLAVSPCADRHAEEWSAYMASTGRFAHRTNLGEVMHACNAWSIGENIAYGAVTADQMMAMWMNSSGHRANILNPNFTHIGVGASRASSGYMFGTQNFLTL